MKRFCVFFLMILGSFTAVSLNKIDESLPQVAPTTVPVVEPVTTLSTTTTTSTTTIAPVSHSSSGEVRKCPKFEPLFEQYGLVPVEVFSYIAWRESRCRIKAINATWDADGNLTYHLNRNKTWDSGLLQVNSSHKTITKNVCGGGVELLMNLDCNLRVAKYLLDNGGLAHWGIKN